MTMTTGHNQDPAYYVDPGQFGSLLPTAPERYRLSDDLRGGVYAEVPEDFKPLLAAEDELARVFENLTAPVETFRDLLVRLGRDLVQGVPLPEDLGAASAAVVQAEREKTAGLNALGSLQMGVTQAWETAARKHEGVLLDQLRPELDEILAQVQAHSAVVATLDRDNFEAVIAATDEQKAALAALKELRPRYRRLRKRHERVLECQLVPNGYAGVWAGVWERRAHEFSRVRYIGPPKERIDSPEWYQPLVTRGDAWLPCADDLDEEPALEFSGPMPASGHPLNQHTYYGRS